MKNTIVLGLCLLFGFQKPLIAQTEEFKDLPPLILHSDINPVALNSHQSDNDQPLVQPNQMDNCQECPLNQPTHCSEAPLQVNSECCTECHYIDNGVYDFASYDCGPFCDQTSCCYGDFWDQATAHDLVISADFLYWSTNYNLPSLVELSTTSTTVLNPGTELINNTIDLVVSRAKKNWTPGFRVGLAWEPQSTCWDVKIIYTNFYNKENSNHTAPVSSLLINFNAKYHLNYNVGDFEIGQTFCIGDSFNLRPFCGVRLGFLKQNSNLTLAEFTPSTTATLGSPFKAHLLQKTWAVGPRIGFDGQWGNFYGVSILGHLSSALLYGEDKLKGNLDLLAIGSTTDFPISETLTNAQISDSSYHLFPALQMFIGLGYETSFLDGYEMKIKAGWESNYWWGAANILLLERAISFQGFTLDLAFTF